MVSTWAWKSPHTLWVFPQVSPAESSPRDSVGSRTNRLIGCECARAEARMLPSSGACTDRLVPTGMHWRWSMSEKKLSTLVSIRGAQDPFQIEEPKEAAKSAA